MSTDPESRGGFGPYLENVGPTFVDDTGVTRVIRYGHYEDVEMAIELHGKNVAAFLVEPIQGEAGYVPFCTYKTRVSWLIFETQNRGTGRWLPEESAGAVQEA
jgi:acetylornithine/succinyldiaminopimelate/putrescine aminotransferase